MEGLKPVFVAVSKCDIHKLSLFEVSRRNLIICYWIWNLEIKAGKVVVQV